MHLLLQSLVPPPPRGVSHYLRSTVMCSVGALPSPLLSSCAGSLLTAGKGDPGTGFSSQPWGLLSSQSRGVVGSEGCGRLAEGSE